MNTHVILRASIREILMVSVSAREGAAVYVRRLDSACVCVPVRARVKAHGHVTVAFESKSRDTSKFECEWDTVVADNQNQHDVTLTR